MACNLGTAVTVMQPLIKLNVRYSSAKVQSARIKKEIREWVVGFCLANHTVNISFRALGEISKPSDRICFKGTPLLLNAVLHFLGSAYKSNVIEIAYPDSDQPDNRPAAVTTIDATQRSQLCDLPESAKMLKYTISINGVCCKPTTFPELVKRLKHDNKVGKSFTGVLNVRVPLKMLDTTSRHPLFSRTYDVECIEAKIIEKLHEALSKETGCVDSIQWSRGNYGISSPVTLHTNALAKRKENILKRLGVGGERQQKTKQPKQTCARRITDALNEEISAVDSETGGAIPLAKWVSRSNKLDDILNARKESTVVFALNSNGVVCTLENLRNTKTARAEPIAYLVWVADTFVAIDRLRLPNELGMDRLHNGIQFNPAFKQCARMAMVDFN
ncbi:hypothetical protein FB645_004558 [Coemansia sp. IMI 203386]|nr:hypothetical protein FB645_004558 [Coemansia sp. IMI 203386]